MGYLSITFAQIVLQILFYLTVNCKAQLEPIVNVTTIKDGEPFTITCSVNRVILSTQDPSVLKIFGLAVNVSTPAHPMGSIAQFHPAEDNPNNNQFRNITTSGWTVNFSGGNGTGNNRQTIKIEVMVQKAVCADAGLYICNLQYLNSGYLQSPTTTQNVTAEAATTEPVLSLLPLKSEANSFSNYSMYDLGEMVTMTCRVNGPPNLAIVWKREMRPLIGAVVFEDYPVQKDISTDPSSPIASSGACSQFLYMSRLKFNVSDQDTKRIYQCIIQANGVDSMTVSATIDLIPVTVSPDTVKTGGGGDKGTVGMYVGIGVGCAIFVIIILVIVLCIVCHRRSKKRDRDTSNDVNNAADHPDSYANHPPYPSVPARVSYGGNPNRGSTAHDGSEKQDKQPNSDINYNRKKERLQDPNQYSANNSINQRKPAARYRNHNELHEDDQFSSEDFSPNVDKTVAPFVSSSVKEKPKPAPKPKPQVPTRREEDRQLHYTQVDMVPSRNQGTVRTVRRKTDLPVEYAEISV